MLPQKSNHSVLEKNNQLLNDARIIIQQARTQVHYAVNTAMVQAYWQIGRLIVEHEQKGESRAIYGQRQLEQLALALTSEFGQSFDITNLRRMRKLYQSFPIRDTLRPELSWTHYRTLLRVENNEARRWYLEGG